MRERLRAKRAESRRRARRQRAGQGDGKIAADAARTCRSARSARARTTRLPAAPGLPSINFGYGGEGESGGVYHSLYDNYEHYTPLRRSGLRYDATLAKTVGRVVLRLADADLPPQRYGDFADTVARYLDEVKKLAESAATAIACASKMEREGDFQLAMDPLKPDGPPEPSR